MANKELINKLTENERFKTWKQDHKDSYLAHIFIMDQDEPKNYCIGYYNNDDTITTFEIKENDITIQEPEEIFKPDDKKIEELDIDKATLTFKQIKDIAEEFREKNYKKEIPNKNILILQNIKLKLIWNVTIITAAFNTLNMNIDANTGEVIKHNLTSLMQMGKFS